MHPAQSEVFPLDFEPILKPDGARKNDCERNAAKRLCENLHERYHELHCLLVEDALHANAPHVRQSLGYSPPESSIGWKFVRNVKSDSHQCLFQQFAGRAARRQVKERRETDAKGVQHHYRWTTHLCLNESATDRHLNFLWYQQTDKQGKVTTWTWITNLPLTAVTVEQVRRAGRSRWKIKNETFNTLQHQGYHFEHNYGHGTQHLATVLALLMWLAFLVDQIQQRCSQVFRQVWRGLGTKAKVWELRRSLFRVLKFPSMDCLDRHVALLYGLLLE